jgi:hypothetical protein
MGSSFRRALGTQEVFKTQEGDGIHLKETQEGDGIHFGIVSRFFEMVKKGTEFNSKTERGIDRIFSRTKALTRMD